MGTILDKAYEEEDEKFKKREECTLSDSQLIEKCENWITDLCRSGGRAWCLRVPVDFNCDPDMLFSELIKRFKNYVPNSGN